MRPCLFALLACVSAACSGEIASPGEGSDDPSMYLTGTEELARQQEDGSYDCDSPRKVLICHIPPGNPDNAHTICVGEPAVRAHQRNHGDPIGACDDGPDDDGPADDVGDDVGDDDSTDDGGDDVGDDVGDDGDPGPDGATPAPEPDAGVVDVD